MKPAGKDGKLYSYTEKLALQGGANVKTDTGGFYKIKTIAATGSAIPGPKIGSGGRKLAPGDVTFLKKNQQLATGDSVIPLELNLIGFVTDVGNSKNGESVDISSQENIESGVRQYAQGAFVESSGQISGFVDVDSEEQRALLNNFVMVTENDGTHITVLPSKKQTQFYMLSRRETDTPGETAMWEHFPVTVESLTMDKPLNGAQNFNFNYKIDGGQHPGVIVYTVPDDDDEDEDNLLGGGE